MLIKGLLSEVYHVAVFAHALDNLYPAATRIHSQGQYRSGLIDRDNDRLPMGRTMLKDIVYRLFHSLREFHGVEIIKKQHVSAAELANPVLRLTVLPRLRN